MKTLFKSLHVTLAVMLSVVACTTGDPFMDGDYFPSYPPGNGGGGNGGSSGPAVKFEINPHWKISYNGREMLDDAEVDRIVVTSSDNEAYYLDLIENGAFYASFSGGVSAYAEAVRDGLSATLKAEGGSWSDLLSVRDSYVLFDRLRAGQWKAFAVGFDTKGNLTGKYALLDFSVSEEKPTPEFNEWLGTWKIGGRDLEGNQISYTVVLRSSEANYAYWLSGWEPTGSMDGAEYEFEVFFNPKDCRLEFNSLYFETLTAKDEYGLTRDYDVCLNGNFKYNGLYYYINEDIPLADGFISEDGRTAEVQGCGITVDMGKGVMFETTLTSMQMMYVPVVANADTQAGRSPKTRLFNENVPQFPLQMEWISAATLRYGTRAETVRFSAPRKARRHGVKVVRNVALAGQAAL